MDLEAIAVRRADEQVRALVWSRWQHERDSWDVPAERAPPRMKRRPCIHCGEKTQALTSYCKTCLLRVQLYDTVYTREDFHP
jgi:hypothetical protein